MALRACAACSAPSMPPIGRTHVSQVAVVLPADRTPRAVPACAAAHVPVHVVGNSQDGLTTQDSRDDDISISFHPTMALLLKLQRFP